MNRALPFFFRELPSIGGYLLSNQAGSHCLLKSRGELENIINKNSDEIEFTKKEELMSKGFISESDDYDLTLESIATKYSTRLNNAFSGPGLFIVVPTLRCDHDCKYCQVSRVPLSKKGYDLSELHIRHILDVIEGVAGNDVKIEFQGGEPLLQFEFIKKFVVEAENRLNSKNLSFVICSALGPIDEDVIDWAHEYGISFSVSLDGSESMHVGNRPSKLFNSFNQTVDNIEKIRKKLGEDRVSCLSTITQNSLSDPESLIRSYYDIGLDGIFLRPLSPFGFARYSSKDIGYTADEYAKFYRKCLDVILNLNKQKIFVEDSTLIRLKKIYRTTETNYVDLQSPAGYALGALVFNYDGNVFGSDEARMLWESTKLPDLILGSITDSSYKIMNNKRTVSLLANTFIESCPGCEDCAYQAYCGADPLYHMATQGDFIGNKAISFHCKLERHIFDHLFELIHSNELAEQVFTKWLSH